ncbi:MAG: hypothetical protein KAH84_01755 [Thiomargarita sp.]|nr:hypothetical protein [Thiomargarita sp.]
MASEVVNQNIYADIIAPEILEKMDKNILEAKRPTYDIIKPKDIFRLRNEPIFHSDLVKFAFSLEELTTIQRKILENWIQGGENKIFLMDDDIENYSSLFELEGANYDDKPHLNEKSSSKHSVNTDCQKVFFGRKGCCSRWQHNYFEVLPPNASIIVENSLGGAVCGSFNLGKSRIYFCNQAHGIDSHRWLLNFYHWIIYEDNEEKIPGKTSTRIMF